MKVLLEDALKKIVAFLNKEKIEYIIIGGIAAGVLGEPRFTGDIDVDIFLGKDDIVDFINKVKAAGFKASLAKCIKTVKERGVFQIKYADFHIDFIIASIGLEEEAFGRKKAFKLYGLRVFFPTPEDFILLKIISARPQDLIDAEKAIIRHKD